MVFPLLLLCAAGEPAPDRAVRPQSWPPYLDAEGMPTRRLTDEELWRTLLLYSATNQAVTDRIVACSPLGRPGWRECVEGR